MYICKVVGKVVSTIKNPKMTHGSLIIVQRMNMSGSAEPDLLVAADTIGCGEGNIVLVTGGSNARYALGSPDSPEDLAVVGIVDSYQITGMQDAKKGKQS